MGLDLPKAEKEYLAWYGEKFKSFDYNKRTPAELEKQMHLRLVNGMKKFKWNKKFAYDMFFHLGDVEMSSRAHQLSYDDGGGNGGGTGSTDCDCMYDLGCGWNNECWARDCKEPEEDCGILGNSQCEGNCDIP